MTTYGSEVKEGRGDSTENIARLEFLEREMLGSMWIKQLFAWILKVGEEKYGWSVSCKHQILLWLI